MYMVFDIGGSSVKYAILDRSGNIYIKDKFPTPKSSLDLLLFGMFDVIDRYDEHEIKGISICCPGVVDSYQGIVYYGGCLTYLHEVCLKEILIGRYNIPVSIENDGKAAALAELWRGGVNESKHAVVMVLGSAIGGGIIIDGKLHRGQNFSAGEVSYMIGDPIENQDLVYKMCGFDASAPKMVSEIAELNGLSPDADGEMVFKYINEQNEESWRVFCEYCRKIARMIISLQYVLDPERFIICGGVSNQRIVRDQIMNEVKRIYQANSMYLLLPVIENSKLNNDANLYGALYHFLEEYVVNAEEYEQYHEVHCPNCRFDLTHSEIFHLSKGELQEQLRGSL
ncbi:ROK family protein [Trichococcus flocculiformis]|uniref:ROK family protein n=1 Tax=Trichococcus flocculiformis TaxID=82803 RepID=UPI002AAB19EB|nr:ROK family protein [Trichococcus flocculiformis]